MEFKMDFRAQIYCETDGIPFPLEPQDVGAANLKSAAQLITGDANLRESGHHGKLAVTIWRKNENPPKKHCFYRA
jgi:hypothetical protein